MNHIGLFTFSADFLFIYSSDPNQSLLHMKVPITEGTFLAFLAIGSSDAGDCSKLEVALHLRLEYYLPS